MKSAIEELACSLGRRDDVPNQELAGKLAQSKDRNGVKELVDHLQDKDPNIASDCIKTLYEVGMLDPSLIEEHVDAFVRLLPSKNNRMVWGAMITLAKLADRQADRLFMDLELIKKITKSGSVITTDNGIKILGLMGSVKPEYRSAVTPFLMDHLRTCRPKEVPQHAESTMPAISDENREEFITVLNTRVPDLNAGGLVRVKKLLKKLV